MGAIWNFWAYKKAVTSGTSLAAQAADYIMFVGTFQGSGVLNRFAFA